MKKILIALIVIVVIILAIIFNPFSKRNNENANNETQINSLDELFASKQLTYKYEESGEKYDVKVTNVSKADDITTVTTERKIKVDNKDTIIKMKYEVSSEKVVESGEYIENGQVVSIIYPSEIIVGGIAVGSEWKSVDGLITNKITKVENNQVTVESTRKVDTYEEGKNDPIQKDFTETRIFEKGKGLISFGAK